MRPTSMALFLCLMIAASLVASPSSARAANSQAKTQSEGITVLATDNGLVECTKSGNKTWEKAPFEAPAVGLARPPTRPFVRRAGQAIDVSHPSHPKVVETTVYAQDCDLMVLSYSGFRPWRPTTSQVIRRFKHGPSLFSLRRPASESARRFVRARRGPSHAVTGTMSTMLRGAGY
jgi:hypothetical protein